MATATREQMVQAIAMLSEFFRSELSELAIEAYLMAVDDLSAADLDRAVKRAVKRCKFMPSGAELRELSREIPSMVKATDDYLNRLFAGFEHRRASLDPVTDDEKKQ